MIDFGSEKEVQHDVLALAGSSGWANVPAHQLNVMRGDHMGDAVVAPLLMQAIHKLNPSIDAPTAEAAVHKVRRCDDPAGFIGWLRDGVPVDRHDRPTVRVRILDLQDPAANDFVVTDEFALKTGGVREPRLDVVFLVNGLPLGVIENKAPTHQLAEAAEDFVRYWDDAPQLAVASVVAGVCNGAKLRVGPTSAPGLSAYKEWKDTYPFDEPEGAGEMERVLLGVFHPHTLIDLAANFVVFETRDGATTKKLARYQQYRAANKIVRRVVESKLDRGIVWHTQGSGKSLTMVFAARKLLASGLDNPTVFIVVDRTDLDEQINDTLTACEFDGVQRVTSRRVLRDLLKQDRRGVIVTTVHKFNEQLSGLVDRENVIVLVDEAHRTQEGDLGIFMRDALRNAKLFAFTGTPVETGDHSTRRAFSPCYVNEAGNEVHEDYLDAYTIKQAQEDGATVPIAYEARMPQWTVHAEGIDDTFEEEFSGLNEEERDQLLGEAAKLAVVAKDPERIAAIAADAAAYLRDHVAPRDFKAQLVAVDREACVLYAEALAKHLQPDEFAVVFSRSKNDTDEQRKWYASAQLARLGESIDGGPVTDVEQDEDADVEAAAGESELGAIQLSIQEKHAVRRLIKRFLDENDPLKLLVVNNMLLTGFDAPLEEVMFLDRGLAGHNLLQAIARTNRPYKNKRYGLIIDYWGVFAQLERALRMFSRGDVERAALRLDKLRDEFPIAIEEALALVAGYPDADSVSKRTSWLLLRFEDDDRAAEFRKRYGRVRDLYETLAPDPGLAAHLPKYGRLVEIYNQWKVAKHEDVFDPAEFAPQTAALVHEAVGVEGMDTGKAVKIDKQLLEQLEASAELTPEEKTAQIESAIVFEIAANEHDPLTRMLSERLEALRKAKSQADKDAEKLLGEYEQLVLDYEAEKDRAKELGLSTRSHQILVLIRDELPGATEEQRIEVAKALDARLAEVAGGDWAKRTDAVQAARDAILDELFQHDAALGLAADLEFVEETITMLAAQDAQSA